RPEEGIMAKRIPSSEPTVKRLCVSEPSVRHLDPQAVADALGGEPCAERIEGRPGPITLYALRQNLHSLKNAWEPTPGPSNNKMRPSSCPATARAQSGRGGGRSSAAGAVYVRSGAAPGPATPPNPRSGRRAARAGRACPATRGRRAGRTGRAGR